MEVVVLIVNLTIYVVEHTCSGMFVGSIIGKSVCSTMPPLFKFMKSCQDVHILLGALRNMSRLQETSCEVHV